MAGVRIFHPTVRGETIALHHGGGGNTGNDFRGRANNLRKAKTYFVDIDSDGFALVSDVVWTRVQEAQSRGAIHAGDRFTFDSTVADPPAINLVHPGKGQELFVPPTKLMTVDGLEDVTEERLASMKAIAEGIAPKGTTVRIAVKRGPAVGNNG